MVSDNNFNNSKIIKRKATYCIKGEPIEILETVRINLKDNEEIFDEELENKNLENIYNQYRKKHSLLMPKKIKEIREKYGVSQRAFSRILGWGEVTIHRYETGALQDRSHNDALVLLENPDNMKILLENNKNKINSKDYIKIKSNLKKIKKDDIDEKLEENITKKYFNEVLDEYCGYTQFNYEKLVNMILFFTSKINRLFKTKLMKLLFYSDFVNFRNNTLSITGLKYIKNYYGPTPIKHELLLGELFEKYITYQIEYVKTSKDNIEEYEFIKSLEKPTMDIFSQEEINSMNEVLNAFKHLTSEEITQCSHKEEAWTKSKNKEIISYEHSKKINLHLA
jgi:putative zinc finger/helix-turn-helix YgiT family protein